jgi:hypothetical protein
MFNCPFEWNLFGIPDNEEDIDNEEQVDDDGV